MPKNVPMPRSSWWLWLSLLFPAVRSLAVSLPGTFLEEKAFRRSSAAARTVSALRREAPRTFASAPDVAAFGAIFTEGVVLRGDLGQPLVRGREEYVRLFRQLAELNAAPLNPWRLGEVKTAFSAGLSADESSCNLLLVRWEVEVTVRSADGGGGVGGVGGGGVGGAKTPGSAVGTNLGGAVGTNLLSGISRYEIDEFGLLSEHALGELQWNAQPLPSSRAAAWLGGLVERGGLIEGGGLIGRSTQEEQTPLEQLARMLEGDNAPSTLYALPTHPLPPP